MERASQELSLDKRHCVLLCRSTAGGGPEASEAAKGYCKAELAVVPLAADLPHSARTLATFQGTFSIARA